MDDATRARLRWLQEHPTERFTLALWHNRVLVVPFVWERHLLPWRKRGTVLTSLSSDGELLAGFARAFSLDAVRGSARRRGAGATRDIVELLSQGKSDICITPDGSRGPRYHLKPGLVMAAQLSATPIYPCSVEFSRRWRLRSWDGFMIPKPFARVTFRLGELLRVAATLSETEFEAERQRCEAALLALVVER
ncbi:MAG: lysophospholipid acyltransferase family protein [Verrucomicrobia bacterium]|nr:lysophospholipid acyltransferase family protein [Verrucomicrobiota bacterium]